MPGANASPSLVGLPVEVIEFIILAARELDRSSSLSMALVCHRLERIAAPLLSASVLLNTEARILAFVKVPGRTMSYINMFSMSFPGTRNERTARLELSHTVQNALVSLLPFPTCASVSHIQLPVDVLAEVIALRSGAGTLHRLTHVSILASLGKHGQPVLKKTTTTLLDCAGALAQLQATHVHVSGASTALVFGAAVARNSQMRVTHLVYDVYPLNRGSGADIYPPQVMHLLPALERMVMRLPTESVGAPDVGRFSGPSYLIARMLSRARRDNRLCVHFAGSPPPHAEPNQFAAEGWRRHANGQEDLWESWVPLV
ncbi:hypothetical protein AURDEDRAFT_156423 [Auricularia subglabra TFB-10046 SS5]|nr:hypothetical protein AURDEDRAFT_156423 [Auricularia subglabra TFB-10046 SS5]